MDVFWLAVDARAFVIYLLEMEMLMDFRFLLAALAALVGPQFAAAQTPSGQMLRTGEQTYLESCKVCHGAGIGGAPAAGDRKAWAPLIGEGQASLTVTAWLGIRAMPARGGRDDLSLEEFARATAWMARSAGGQWADPDASLLKRMRELEQKRLATRSKRQAKPGS